ncbi:MAG: response regulator transcription factor [Nocardioides sp.]|uniref:response regulator n=1 Tax=Nocardioides sp. TaxID=35761 RepID=UPI0039E2C09B
MIRVVIVDDHPVFRLGMAGLLASLDDIAVVGQATSAGEARELIGGDEAPEVDVVLMDLHLGDGSGVEVTRDLVSRHPDLKVLVITMLEDDESVVAAVRAGARGYVLKGATPDVVERAIRAVANGEMILGPQVAARAMSTVVSGRTAVRLPFPELSDREREVLDLVARGFDNAQIARRLVLSPKTVRNHVSSVLTKLALPDRSAAIIAARDAGLGVD